MNENLIRKTKFFWPWQDREEEAWLEEMSRQGLHLRQARTLGRYVFEKGAPKAYAYRLDYQDSLKDEQHYLKLFEDAGWQRVAAQGGWHYFRQEIQEGQVPEIFSDTDSKIKKYERVKTLLVSILPIYVLAVVLNVSQPYEELWGLRWWLQVCGSAVGIPVFGTAIVLSVITWFKLDKRIRELRGLQ